VVSFEGFEEMSPALIQGIFKPTHRVLLGTPSLARRGMATAFAHDSEDQALQAA
jgi:hypothetical protein